MKNLKIRTAMVGAASYREDRGPQTLFSLICKKKKEEFMSLKKI